MTTSPYYVTLEATMNRRVKAWLLNTARTLKNYTLYYCLVINVLQNTRGGGGEGDGGGDVREVVKLCDSLVHVTSLFNQVFSSTLTPRCGLFLASLLCSGYLLCLSLHFTRNIVPITWYTFSEVLRFCLLCHLADSLRQAHLALEDAVWSLHQHLGTTHQHYPLLTALITRLNARPAHITVLGVGVLGKQLLVSLVNTALTYTAILYQYRPDNLPSVVDLLQNITNRRYDNF
ncbi:putative 7tm Chemosensory receptor-containing protein 6 [Homarus americanus]|uniref:Putative 7tm Chemosensory receptor-containing protein 6 n=1 Tax=Homarus americanus TaxID=6706 RepID=A0A8J5N8I4_HOMAM|nr:putative 7tm Chemosensory receptor-containing protein 6 [Homarus americanus]